MVIRCAYGNPRERGLSMSDEDLEMDDDDFIAEDAEDADEVEEVTPTEVAKSTLSKRRVIDHLLEERRLQKQLAEYDFDLDWSALTTRLLWARFSLSRPEVKRAKSQQIEDRVFSYRSA